MNPRYSTLLSLCVVAILASAFAASTAAGAELRSCGKAAAGSTAKRYTTSSCGVSSTAGEYETAPLTESQTVVPKLTSERAVLKGTVSGIELEISCTGITSANSKAQNLDSGLPTASAKGSGKTILLGCKVEKPAAVGCAVPETVETSELNFAISGLTTKFEPASGEEVVTFTISGCTGAASALNGAKVFKGSISAVTPEGSPSAQEFTAGSGSSLKVVEQSIGFTAVVHDATVNGSIIGLVTPGQPTAHECRKETGSGTGGLYADGTCSAGGGKSEFERVPITGSQSVVPRLTSETVAFGVPFLAGSNFPVVCTGLTSTNSKIENASSGGKMEVKGTGVLRLTGCKPDGEILGCKLTSETIETGSSTSTNETQTTFSGVSLSVTLTKCEAGNGKHTASGSIAAISRESTPYVLEFTTSSGTSLTWNNKFTAVIDLETEDGTKVGLETP